ncbi:zinc ABC transporter ATP-binding protein ZnuC [Endozoicomonas sp. SM1973]|uniref:Zinc ABC transporter ATP-binding protein ZnuC n=1 Tax=Spartinivicinus marinus TaxID=2994442 RepID=A0A853I5R5_9GAMM|nr:zinc ABC transporter ATP-binding protein ZnuC [Spartinivicinus marinus]MCX4026731.1 zinc ABC transporter ATP-binding protein ZnuC [Spartinivicinus marinus]NYZ64565.1 zinc ABC transporter ATP-binding protein ZnuC [Spartinivicinus marinus]
MAKLLVSLTNIDVSFQQRQILQGVNLTLHQGEIVTLIGPNGAGKTTLVKLVLGLVDPGSGERFQLHNLRIGYMPQRLHIEPTFPLTVERFLALAGRYSTKEITAVLERVGVLRLQKSPVQKVSGGEMQRILLARGLLRKPQLMVLDEPVQGVDINGQKELYQLIKSIRNETGCGVLMVSHDLHLVMAATDRVVCLNRHICCSGSPSQISSHPEYLALFGEPEKELAVYTHHHDHKHGVDGKVINSKTL